MNKSVSSMVVAVFVLSTAVAAQENVVVADADGVNPTETGNVVVADAGAGSGASGAGATGGAAGTVGTGAATVAGTIGVSAAVVIVGSVVARTLNAIAEAGSSTTHH